MIRSLSNFQFNFLNKYNKSLANVVIELDLKTNDVLYFHGYYLRLSKIDGLVKIYKELALLHESSFHNIFS